MTEARIHPYLPASGRRAVREAVVSVNGAGVVRHAQAGALVLPPPHVTAESQNAPHADRSFSQLSLLIIDNDLPVLKACGEIAAGMGFNVTTAHTASAARDYFVANSPDVVLMDLKMPSGGLTLLEEIRAKRPRCSVVVMTAFATVTSAIEAMRIGATDYLTKPFAMDELNSVLDRAAQRRSFEIESKRIQGQLATQRNGLLIGTSPEMERLHRIVLKVAPAAHPVLILGEGGTGKEAVGRAIHASGPLSSRRFSVLECEQLSPAVLEAELFGYVRSPNTGESRPKEGALTAEMGGTLFLDGIDEIPLELQARLLRALQDKKVRPAGSDQAVPVTVRLLAASSRNLSALVDQGAFRKDLFYKLNVVSLRIPPLRERRQDIPILTEYFLERIRRESPVAHRFAVEAMQMMMSYDWPGNVRELENAIDKACATASGPILHAGDLPPVMVGAVSLQAAAPGIMRVDERERPNLQAGAPAVDRRAPAPIISIADLEREAILHTIRQLRGDKLMAAKLLGIGKTTLYRKLKEYGITD